MQRRKRKNDSANRLRVDYRHGNSLAMPRQQPPRSVLGARVQDERARAGLSQADLAAMAGIAQSVLSEIETSENPNPKIATLAAIEDALGLQHGSLYLLADEHRHAEYVERFILSPVADSLHLDEEDKRDLRTHRFYGTGEEPSDDLWMDFVRLRRALRRKSKNVED